MSWAAIAAGRRVLAREQGAVVKDWGGKLPVALVYPNSYYVGMSSLAVATLYRMLNARSDVACERVFCGYRTVSGHGVPLSIETQRPLHEFALIAVSFSFELDYFNWVSLLRSAGIPALTAERTQGPFILAGGPAVSANPEPLAGLCDAFMIGEVEQVLPQLMDTLCNGIGGDRQDLLRDLTRVPGLYVPALLPAVERAASTQPIAPRRVSEATSPEPHIERQWVRDLDAYPTHTSVCTHATEFGDLYLMEIARGCAHGCRFCLAGCIYRPARERSPQALLEQARLGKALRSRVGLVSAAVSDYTHIEELVQGLRGMGLSISVSSLRVDPLPEALLAALAEGGARTLTIAPEAGSERLREAIRKRISREDILNAARRASLHGFRELKLYFMLGLPGEEDEDVQAIVDLVREIAAVFGGRVWVSVALFVPKPHTAFERQAQEREDTLRRRLRTLQAGLRSLNVRMSSESVPWARVQAALARGDRRLGPVLAAMQTPTLADWDGALREHGLACVDWTRSRAPNERLPWDLVRTTHPHAGRQPNEPPDGGARAPVAAC